MQEDVSRTLANVVARCAQSLSPLVLVGGRLRPFHAKEVVEKEDSLIAPGIQRARFRWPDAAAVLREERCLE